MIFKANIGRTRRKKHKNHQKLWDQNAPTADNTPSTPLTGHLPGMKFNLPLGFLLLTPDSKSWIELSNF